jgi:hypothetical protein
VIAEDRYSLKVILSKYYLVNQDRLMIRELSKSLFISLDQKIAELTI